MNIIKQQSNSYILRFDRGEEFISAIQDFCTKNNIKSGYFHGIGACHKLELSWYNLQTKKYETKVIEENLEITSLTGNIALIDGSVFAHTHGVFGGRQLQAIAGHVKSMEISATCEIKLDIFEGTIERIFDEATGLKLMK
ncbi:DNA-binding protein [Candidatus Roizmanbacteria bacterium]|nr:MAG: DNA-binding protein [Candidatus Roizmanbacteria bacterium]